MYSLQEPDAAQALGVGRTLLKKICRAAGIKRWPYRKLSSLQSLVEKVRRFSCTRLFLQCECTELALSSK